MAYPNNKRARTASSGAPSNEATASSDVSSKEACASIGVWGSLCSPEFLSVCQDIMILVDTKDYTISSGNESRCLP